MFERNSRTAVRSLPAVPAAILLVLGLGLVAWRGDRAALDVRAGQDEPRIEDEGERLFADVVAPLLTSTCFECHGPDTKRIKGGLRLDGRAALLAGGFSGPSIDPADASGSLLVRALRYQASGQEMPPDGPLPADVVDAVERWVALGAPWPANWPRATPERTPEEIEAIAFFENEVRPLLAASCFECHGPKLDEVKSGLRMASREHLLQGGSRGPAIVPGDPSASLLVRAVHYQPGGLAMPPQGPLTPEDISKLERWIAGGAVWPDGAEILGEGHGFDIEGRRSLWPYAGLERPDVPEVAGAAHPIDAFVRTQLAEAGIEPNPRASDRELVQRLYYDLHGLPASYAEVEAFVADPSPDRYEVLVDRLLASPRYGEHWARMWLDVVRYAQTDGFESDGEKPLAWRYRDYVIDSFNRDVPYDRFLREQIAGDELYQDDPRALVATGFYRLGPYDAQTDDDLQAEFDGYDDMVRVISEGVLGMTVGCARCHDHKFDPILQEDYYGLLGFVRNVRPYASPEYSPTSATLALVGPAHQMRARWQTAVDANLADLKSRERTILDNARAIYAEELLANESPQLKAAWATPPARRTRQQAVALEPILKKLEDRREVVARIPESERRTYQRVWLQISQAESNASFEGEFDWVLAVRESTGSIIPNMFLARGEPTSPMHEVAPRFPVVLFPDTASAQPALPQGRPFPFSTGRRSVLAEWIAGTSNPLTPRVMANRIWKGLFGRGIVATPNDFGAGGLGASNPELLDWLACEFRGGGYSTKSLVRLIVSSQAYQVASRELSDTGALADPANDLFWRQNVRRFSAEAVHDALLLASGELNLEGGGRGYFQDVGREVLGGASRPGEGWSISSEEERRQRSIYSFVKRGMLDPLAVGFDVADTTMPVGARAVTTTPTQALMLMNGAFVDGRARALARRALAANSTDRGAAAIELFRAVLARDPSPAELEDALDHVADLIEYFAGRRAAAVLEPGVPDRVSDMFFEQLTGEDVLRGPTDGLYALRGRFHNPYNATVEIDPARGPVRLVNAPRPREGRVDAAVELTEGCTSFSIIVGAERLEDVFAGLEVRLDPDAGVVELLRHPSDPDAAPHRLAVRPAAVAIGRELALSLDYSPERLTLALDGEVVLDETKLFGSTIGMVGLGCWGDAALVYRFVVEGNDKVFALAPETTDTADVLALASLALVLLNSNEFIHVP